MIYRFQRTLSHRLLAWSVLSILTGVVLWVNDLRLAADSQGLGLQFVLWGAIDALIALFGLRGLSAKIRQVPNLAQAEKDTTRLRRLLWLNTGLDVLYVAGGAALLLTVGQADAFARGSGTGILIQGAFLFFFDLMHALAIPREQTLPHMPQFDQPAHQPFDLPGQRGTVILVHGFPGTPIEMRDLGQALNRQGWRAIGLLLPGYGREIDSLFQQRASGWIAAIAAAVEQARAQTAGPVILVGFSMGAGLSVSAAAQARPDALVLISPFWLDLSPVLTALGGLASIFLPEHFNPFRLLPANRVLTSDHFHPPPGDLYPPAPEFFRNLSSGLHVPLLFLEQFLELSRLLKRNAPRLTTPILIVQGEFDPIVRPALTRRLAAMLKSPPRYQEIQGEHHITIQSAPGYTDLEAAIIDFVNSTN
jgi:carboxylesterase